MLFILNQDLQIVNVLSMKGVISKGNSVYFEDYHKQMLSTGAETFEFKTMANSKESENLVAGNYIAFREDEQDKLFNIIETMELKNEDGFIKHVYCEMHGIELRNSILRPMQVLNASPEKFASLILENTDWQLGIVDDIGILLDINIENHMTVYDAIQQYLVEEYGMEIYYTVDIQGNSVVNKYLNIVESRGFDHGLRFTYNKNIQDIERTIDVSELCTALIGVGNNDITFKSVEADDKPLNQDFIASEEAYKQWSINGYHIFGYEKFETDSPQELLKLTRKKLEERRNPKVKYSLNVELLDEKVSIGDYVRITDMEFEPAITLEARINVLTRSKTDIEGNTCEIANFRQLQSNITEQMRNLAYNLKGYVDNANIDNINKGGFLTSKIEPLDDTALRINNRIERGRDFCLEVKHLKPTPVITDFEIPNGAVMQQSMIDYYENKIYVAYDNTGNGNLTLLQMDMNGKLLGRMNLNSFGHGNSMGIERRNDKTYIWSECDGKKSSNANPEKLRGSKICYFEFRNGVTAEKTYGKVIDILPGWVNLTLAVDTDYNQLAVRGFDKIGGTAYYHIYDLKSVINGSPKLLKKFKDIPLIGSSALQGFDLHGRFLYIIQGAGYYDIPAKMDTYIQCLDLDTMKIRYTHLIDILPDMPYREIEGIKVVKRSENTYELQFGMVSELQRPRKNHIFKYVETIMDEEEALGKFVHPNGKTTLIREGLIKVDKSKRKGYLMYVVDGERFNFEEGFSDQIILANYENGTWYCDGKVFTPMTNDCIIGNLDTRNNNETKLTIYAENNVSVGSTISGSSDALTYENGKIQVNAGGLIGILPSNLLEVEGISTQHLKANSISADKIQANSISADKIQANSIETNHLKANVFEAIDAKIQNAVIDKATIGDLTATNAKIENLEVDNANIHQAIINKADIIDLNATNANIENLNVEVGNIKELTSQKANIDDLKATNAVIENLKANKADVTDLNAVNATIGSLQAGKADITELNAVKGNITQLESEVAKIGTIKSDVADIEHILAGNITADNIQTGAITAGSGIIADGAIGSAQISSIDAGKISAGKIDTSKVEVAGTNNHLRIKGNRIQVFQGTGNQAKERVSLGDVNGNGSVYGLRVRGADGQTILLDENGVKSEGITDGAITNDKISDNANIDGAKLNINSVVSKINEDGTETIQGTKIEVEGTTLNTKLSTITNKQTQDSERISQAQAEITANTNAIKLKVDEQTYTADKKDMTSKLNKNTSEISAMKGQIALKVEQTDIDNASNVLKSEIKTELNEVHDRIDGILDNVGGAIADGIIDESETIMINSSITQLNKEKETLTQRYNYIYNLSTLSSSMKSSLKTTMDNYNSKQSALISHIQSMIKDKHISDSERQTYNTRLAEYSTALANVNKKIEECMDSISSSKVDSAKAEIKVTTDAISQNVSNLSQTVSTKADGSTVTAINNKVGTLETNVNGISGKITNLEKTTTNLGNSVSGVQGEVGTLKSDVASLEVTTSGISQKVSNVETTTSSLTQQVTTAQNTANQAKTDASNANKNATNAMNKANSANSLADSKAKVFTTTPTVPYKIGDLWVQGTSGDVMRCKTARTSGSYTASDWEKASKYTDDTKANAVDGKVTTLQGTVNSTSSKVATLETNLEGITQRVSSTESTTSSLTTKVNNAQSTANSAATKADNAQSTANTAKNTADSAKSQANTNKDNISTLQSTVTSTSSKVASLETNLNSVTSRVSATENTTSNLSSEINGVKGNVSNLTSRVSNAESKLTKDSLTTTIGNHYTTKTDVDGIVTSKGYQTQSQVQQTVDGLQVKVQQSGGYNLLRNGCAKNGTAYWSNNGGGISVQDANAPTNEHKYFNSSFPSGITGEWVQLKNNTYYTYSAKINLASAINMTDTTPLHFWCNTTQTSGNPQLSVISRSHTSIPANQWVDIWVTFKTATSNTVWFKPFLYTGGSSVAFKVTELMLCEGSLDVPYAPHPSEVYDGITQIDKDGIKIKQSNINGYTHMNANGFYVNKSGEDVVKVTNDGVYIKGRVDIVSGSVPTSSLSGTINSNQLNSTITNDISTAKNNASSAITKANNAQSTADSATTKANNAQNTANSAVSKADSAQSTANTANNTLNSNKDNWSNAYNRVKEWANGAITGSTSINGGMIATNTITANKIAVGDFNNYSQLRKGHTLSNSFGNAYWGSDNAEWYSSDNYFPVTIDNTDNAFSTGDEINFKATIWIGESRNMNFGVWFYNANKGYVCDNTTSVKLNNGWNTVNATIKLSNANINKCPYMQILINNGGTYIAVKDVVINRKITGELIVDGAINGKRIEGAEIVGSTFMSKSESFKVTDDGRAEATSMSIEDEISTDTLSVNYISNSKYQSVLDRSYNVHINPWYTEEEEAKELVHGGRYRSFDNLINVCPRNLNGYNLTINLWSDIDESVNFNMFNSGTVTINLNGCKFRGYMICQGHSMKYRIYGKDSDNTGTGTYGSIMPHTGHSATGGNYSIQVSYSHLVAYDLKIYGGKGSGNNNGISVTNLSKAYLNNLQFVSCYSAVRSYSASDAYVASSNGLTSSHSFYASSGSRINLNGTNQAGRSGSTSHTGTSGNGQIYASGVSFDGSSVAGSNDTPAPSKVTKTATITANYGDTYRKTVYNSWKKDGTVRQGEWASYGDCIGAWFFGTKIEDYSNKEITKVEVTVKRQAGGSNGEVVHTLKMHNQISRPSGSLSFRSDFSKDFKVAVNNSFKVTLSTSDEIAAFKKCKGFGLEPKSYNQTYYSVCSGSLSVKITYKE